MQTAATSLAPVRAIASTLCALASALTLSACAVDGTDAEEPGLAGASQQSAGETLGCDEASVLAATPAGRRAIIDRALHWVDLAVPYSKTSSFEGYRTDCSGFVSMCWQLPTNYSSHQFAPYPSSVSHSIGMDELIAGDGLNRANVPADDGHVAIFARWLDAGHTRACIISESGHTHPTGLSVWSASDLASYAAFRFDNDPPGVFASSAQSSADVAAVWMNGTGTGRTEVHVLGAQGNYQGFAVHAATPLGPTDPAQWTYLWGDYDRDGVADLYAIAMNATGSGRTEVHVISAASGYTDFVLHAATALPETSPAQWAFALGDQDRDGRDDLIALKLNGTGTRSTEVHVLPAASDFGAYGLETGTPLEETHPEQWAFLAADVDRDGVTDVVGVKMNGTGTGGTEVHVLAGGANYQAFALHTGTALGATDRANWSFAMGDQDHDGAPDLLAIARQGAAGTEVHVLAGASSFATFGLETGTPLGASSPSQWAFASR